MARLEIQYSVKLEDKNLEEDLHREVMARSEKGLEKAGRRLLRAIRAKLNQRGHGRVYPSKTGKGRHKASAPGEPPAPDRKVYRDSFYFKVTQYTYTTSLALRSSLWNKFGRRLELGGHGGGGYIAPRPHVRPVYEETEADIVDLLEREI